VWYDFDKAALSLLSQLDQKKQERWEEAVNSIDFSHSSRKAWRTINKLIGRSGRSSHFCPISANSIALQLVKNAAHKAIYREPTRLVNKELSDLCKIPTPLQMPPVSAGLGRTVARKSSIHVLCRGLDILKTYI